jgi:hypothetical protein
MWKNLLSTDDNIHTWRPSVLLGAIVVQIVVLPFAEAIPLFWEALSLVVVAAAVVVASYTQRALRVAAALAVPIVVIDILRREGGLGPVAYLRFAFTAALYGFVIALMLRRLFRAKVVRAETIILAVSTYLMIGIVWTIAYVPLEILRPGSFHFPAGAETPIVVQLHYFSFVTLTTLGYGDITPIAPLARSLAVLEAICGALFLAILIARLVADYRAPSNSE